MAKGGAKPGERRGGRKKGSRNKAIVEREILQEQRRLREQARYADKDEKGNIRAAPKLAKQVIEEFMNIAIGYAARAQQADDEQRFREWARLACAWAKDLAPYQSPTFRAIIINPETPKDGDPSNEAITTLEGVRKHLLLTGVPVDQVAKALIAKEIMLDATSDNGQEQQQSETTPSSER